ncbi:glutathione ABC transporter substrate-binding protein [Viridibacillus arvi]|uniref:glutathione ABC transporter substrate-binding protein n=1 Tax=Viridibacillus arvi TaxID=263475 RepID=UPI003D04AEE3
MKKLKWLSKIAFVAIMVFMLQACSTGSGNKDESGNKGNTSEGKEGGNLVVVRLSDATGLDPHFITDIPSANIVYEKVYETLVTFDKERNIKPLLATEWEQVDDLTWNFTLQEGIKYHDGSPFNADAVKTSFDRLLDPKTGSPQKDKLGMISEIIVEDDTHVTFKLSEPYAPLLSILASNEGSILSPKSIKEAPDTLATKPVGTGPFVFDSWKSGQQITLKRNEEYWGEKVKIDSVEFKVVPEDATRLAMIESGEAHVSDQVPVTEIDRINGSDKLNLFRTDGLAVEYVGFNTSNAPLDNVKLRKAISYAIEREAIIEGVYNDVGTLANVAMSPKVFGYTKDVHPYPYDVNKAKELLKEAGYDKGLKIKLLTNDRKERINVAEVIQSQLKGIGVEVEIQVMEYGAYIDAISKGTHQMFLGGWGNATGDGDYNQFNLFHSASVGAPGNHFYYKNSKVDKIIEEARAEPDASKRQELYKESMELEIEDAVYVPIRNYEHLAVYNNEVDNFWLDASNYLMLQDVTLK